MDNMALQKRNPFSGTSPAFVTALLIVLFLFYIDEGYYDFRWMRDAGNWLVFCVYFIFTFTLMWIISHFLLGKLSGGLKWVAVLLAGFSITLFLLFV